MTFSVRILCGWCTHLHLDNPDTCDAYPNGIPDAINYGEISHIKPYDGDNGIVFQTDTPNDDILQMLVEKAWHEKLSEVNIAQSTKEDKT